MISQIDEQLRDKVGVGAPVRYILFLQVVKLKTFRPLEGKKLHLKIKAMNEEVKVEVLADNLIKDHPMSAIAQA